MSVTQSWNMILVPASRENEIGKEYSAALATSKQYLHKHRAALEKWKDNPKVFAWHTLACDIHDKHLFYNSWVGNYLQEYFRLYIRQEFYDLFFKYFKLDGPGAVYGDFKFSEVIFTSGNTPADIFYQALGPVAVESLPEFFGNFFIKSKDIHKVLVSYESILNNINRTESILRAAEWYGSPCNCVSENIEEVENILNAYQKALNNALSEKCGLLGLTVTAG